MIETDRVLRPLLEAEPAIEKLETYESPAALQDALRAVWHAAEQTLRLVLRGDAGARDDLRMSALAPATPMQDVLAELRSRDRISIELAGRFHELTQAVQRGESGDVRAADADTALALVRGLQAAVHELADEPMRASAHAAVLDDALGDDVHPVPRSRRLSRPAVLAMAAATVLLLLVLAVLLFGRTSDMEQGIAAFREERYGVAEQRFRSALGRNADNVTARLYLARILRAQGRNQEVAELLRGAAEQSPRDAAVRRELGYLFLDLQRPESAVEQFRIAVEQEPEEHLNWVGLVEAMYRAGDPEADEMLRRAPAGAQAMIRTGRQ